MASYSETVVSDAIDHLRTFADRRGLGSPVKVLFMDEMFVSGVGCEWPGEVRNAVAFKGASRSADATEAKRRLKEWAV